MAGISGYGVYIPMYRIRAEEIAAVWHDDVEHTKTGLNVKEKTVPGRDEDAATIAVEAARQAVFHSGVAATDIGAIYVGSESHPYAVKPTATIVSQAIGAGNRHTAADLEFACKAGTAGVQIALGLVGSGMVKYGMAIGSDTSQGMPSDQLEYTAGAGGAAFIIGRENTIADVLATESFTSDTPDFWRREGIMFPSHGGRVAAEPGYFKHIIGATNLLFEKTGLKPADFKYAVFHQPNGKFPVNVAARLGFTNEQIAQGLMTPKIGNTYSAASLIGLASVLDVAKPGEKILVTSFGSGAGSDSFAIEVKDAIEEKRDRIKKVTDMVENKKYIDYATYLRHKHTIRTK